MAAAGQARRFSSGSNKIWALLAGRSLLEHVLAVFEAEPHVGSVVVVANSTERELVEKTARTYKKVQAVVPGGATRAESVFNGLIALPSSCEYVLVHDAARPLLSTALVERVLQATVRVGAAVPALPIADTVKRVDENGFVRATVPRYVQTKDGVQVGLAAVQTPQGARISLLRQAYAQLNPNLPEFTDESSLIEAMGWPVAVVEGDFANIKVTLPEDLSKARILWAMMHYPKNFRVGYGYDVHPFASPEMGRKLVLGGMEIPHEVGLEGHSDADVLLHAICDALLGAAGLGDIGILFPNTDPMYKDVSSLKLLDEVGERVRKEGWEIGNVDATLMAEEPKLKPYRETICKTIAMHLRVTPEQVSVKATTNERMGFVGRKEGIACSAVVTLFRPIS